MCATALRRTEKSQGTVTVTLPILDVLAATLDAGPCGDLAFICGVNRKPYTKESFGNLFREACDAAGVFGKSAHVLRKIGATRAADNIGVTTRGDIRLARRRDGVALHKSSQSQAACDRGDVEARANEKRTDLARTTP
jgi:hypothetical protein